MASIVTCTDDLVTYAPQGDTEASFLVSDRFHDNAAIRRVSIRAAGAWVLIGSRCAADAEIAGLVTRDNMRGACVTPAILRELVDSGLLDLEGGDYWLGHGHGTNYLLWRIVVEPQRGRWISNRDRRAIYARNGFACVTCGSSEDLTLDHIFPRALGGSDDPSNLQTMCRSCNSRKGARV